MLLNEWLGIELPIIQAPMAGVQHHALAAAVCAAGGLGSLPAGMLDADGLRDEIVALRAATGRPFNLNFMCHHAPPRDATSEQRWHETLAPYYRELGLDPATAVPGKPRRGFDRERAELVVELKPPVVSFCYGLPDAALFDVVKSSGARILATATTVAEACWLEAHGADLIVAQGVEAGGHRGMFLTDDLTTQLSTMALVPQVVRAVRLPVVAAGGIADHTGVRAALALGAVGVQVGTSYLLCDEARTRAVHRAALKSEAASHTALTNVFSGGWARGIVNRSMRELGPASSVAPPFPWAGPAFTPLRAAAEARGSDDFSWMWAGQNVTGCAPVSAAVVTQRLAGTATRT
ncbi:MAG TPA: nitronate monooxygenase [Nevskiaceae bacterium]|nr:nitronate monooxygenase [Nevskiaceae bacterium]